MTVLEHETDQLLNNLTIQHIVGLPEIADFRVDLIDAISSLGITEEEKNLLRRVNSIKQDNLKWQALSSALNNTMLITGGGNISVQAGFQTLLTAARTAVEYKTASNDLQIEELQAMWELRKDDLKTFANLRKEALSIIFSLYQKYNLKESDRLTEQSSQQFQKIISEPNPQRMVRLLMDNQTAFGHMAEYYYYLGMGYLDCGQPSKANDAFAQYENLYSKAPIYRVNEKNGLISLAKLSYNLANEPNQIRREISNVVENLPTNSMALVQCAVAYDVLLKDPKSAISLLRSALDSDQTTDKSAIALAASTILPKIPSNSTEYIAFVQAFNNQQAIDFDAELNMLISQNHNVWNFLRNTISIKGLASCPFYRSKWFFGTGFFCDQSINVGKKIKFIIPSKYSVDINHIQMWVEKHKDDDVELTQYVLKNADNVSLEDIEDIDCFKHNPNLKFLYMEAAENDKEYRVKYDIDLGAIERENFPRQSEFTLTEKDLKQIVKFLKKHSPTKDNVTIVATPSKDKTRKIEIDSIDWKIKGDSISLTGLRHCALQDGITYVRFMFDDARKIQVCYKYNNVDETLDPCYWQYNGKRYFVNNEYLEEFGYREPAPKEDEESWWSKIWNGIKNWELGIWDTIYGWF